MGDPYLYPGTSVLINRFEIRKPKKLAQLEADLAFIALLEIGIRPLSGDYDLCHLRDFHRAVFGRIYPWAGEIRTVPLARTDVFTMPEDIEPVASRLFGQLKSEAHLRGLSRRVFVDRLTFYFAEVNTLHPFREGNGRAQRAFFTQMAQEAGYTLSWDRARPQQNMAASWAALKGDNSLLRQMLQYVVSSPLPIASGGDDGHGHL